MNGPVLPVRTSANADRACMDASYCEKLLDTMRSAISINLPS